MTIKKIDELGRIVIPKNIRDQLRLTEGIPLLIHCDTVHKKIMICKEIATCAICGSKENLMEKENIILCKSCCLKIKDSF